jgi:ABC-type sugar transport system ATPase subunit
MDRLPQLDLEIRGLRKRYGSFTAVDDVSLQVGAGQFVCLLGPSGCGKTTTLRCVAGLEDPDAGDILIGGREVTRDPPWQRDIAMMFQDFALFPHMTVAKQVGFGLEMRRVPRAERDLRDHIFYTVSKIISKVERSIGVPLTAEEEKFEETSATFRAVIDKMFEPSKRTVKIVAAEPEAEQEIKVKVMVKPKIKLEPEVDAA